MAKKQFTKHKYTLRIQMAGKSGAHAGGTTRRLAVFSAHVTDAELMLDGADKVKRNLELAFYEMCEENGYTCPREVVMEGQINLINGGVDVVMRAYVQRTNIACKRKRSESDSEV